MTKRKRKKRVSREAMEMYGNPMGVKVVNNDVSSAIRAFKKKVKESGKLETLREKQHHVKKSEKRRKEIQAAKRRQYIFDIRS